MLRALVLAYGVLSILGAVILALTVHAGGPVALYLLVNGVVVTAALLFERHRYRPAVDRTHGPWQLTEERFVDPATGKLMRVRYNPRTGERDYVEEPAGTPVDSGEGTTGRPIS